MSVMLWLYGNGFISEDELFAFTNVTGTYYKITLAIRLRKDQEVSVRGKLRLAAMQIARYKCTAKGAWRLNF